jgi:tripartite-type tricarboxylate transporter receptor subunit TctC
VTAKALGQERIMKPNRAFSRVWPAIVIAFAFAAGVMPVRAQDYPSRPVTVIVPFPPGGASDVVARIVTNEMAKILGQSFIIENVSGAGGTLGSARAAAAAPDGYTLLAAAMGSHVAAPVLTPNVKYDPVADFVPIGITAHSPAVVIARKDFPARDLKEFVAVLRQQGDALKQAHGGIGASSHMACLLFNAEIGVNYEMSVWAGLFAPRGVAAEIIARLADALDKALDEPVVRETLAKLGGSIPAKAERNRAAFDRFVRSEIARWAPILTKIRTEK